MGTTGYHWKAQVPDHARQAALATALTELGTFAEAYFDEPEPVLVDRPLRGEYLVKRALLGRSPTHAVYPEIEGWHRSVGGRLYGVAFRFWDDRPYHWDTRLSFLFLRHADPALDGLLVECFPGMPESPFHPAPADRWERVTAPSIFLRGYLEDWVVQLLAWVRRYHLPELEIAWDDTEWFARMAEEVAPGGPFATLEAFRARLERAEGGPPEKVRAERQAAPNPFLFNHERE